MPPILSIQNFTKTYNGVKAVNGLSLDVEEGEIFGLIGPDGAGKTTALRLMLGIVSADSGTGHVGPYDLARQSESVSQLTGYVSQRFSLYGELTVQENLELFADLYGVPETERNSRLERLMRFSRLDPFRDRLAANLSGGMKQKLALSCALIHTPKLLLLDEPTTGVDPLSRRDLWRLLFDLWQEGTTIIVTTPYMDEAERCSRIGLIDRGTLVASGKPEALRGAFQGSIVEVRTNRRFEAQELLAKLPGVRDVAIFGEGLHATLGGVATEALQGTIRATLESQGIGVISIALVEPTMEDVFFQITKGSGPRT